MPGDIPHWLQLSLVPSHATNKKIRTILCVRHRALQRSNLDKQNLLASDIRHVQYHLSQLHNTHYYMVTEFPQSLYAKFSQSDRILEINQAFLVPQDFLAHREGRDIPRTGYIRTVHGSSCPGAYGTIDACLQITGLDVFTAPANPLVQTEARWRMYIYPFSMDN